MRLRDRAVRVYRRHRTDREGTSALELPRLAETRRRDISPEVTWRESTACTRVRSRHIWPSRNTLSGYRDAVPTRNRRRSREKPGRVPTKPFRCKTAHAFQPICPGTFSNIYSLSTSKLLTGT